MENKTVAYLRVSTFEQNTEKNKTEILHFANQHDLGKVHFVKEICIYSVKGNWQLNDTIQSKIIALAFSMAAEIERDLISQRTKEALQFKKAQGMKLGRPKGKGKSKLDAFRPEIESLLANGSTQKFVAKRYKTTEANLHNWLKKHNLMTARQRSQA